MKRFWGSTFLVLLLLAPLHALADAEANALMKRIHERDRGKDLIWDVDMDLIDRNGETRKRTGKIFRRELGPDRTEQITVFLSPNNIRHTALLDIESPEGDFMWLYVPALKVTKRVPPADRGDKFVGTDFTMEDINLGFEHDDYHGTIEQKRTSGGHPTVVMRLEPKTTQLARELGFDDSVVEVRTDQAIIVDQRFFHRGREIRHNQALKIKAINGILTPMELRSEDLVNQHRTVLRLRKATYNSGVPASHFSKEALGREMYR